MSDEIADLVWFNAHYVPTVDFAIVEDHSAVIIVSLWLRADKQNPYARVAEVL